MFYVKNSNSPQIAQIVFYANVYLRLHVQKVCDINVIICSVASEHLRFSHL